MKEKFFTAAAGAVSASLLGWAFYPTAYGLGGAAAVAVSAAFFTTVCLAAVFFASIRLKQRGLSPAFAVFPWIVLLTVLAVVLRMDFFTVISPRENKMLAFFPNVNPFHENFPKKMDSYINDRIGFRAEALEFGRFLNVGTDKVINSSTLAVRGRDNWIYLNEHDENAYDFQRVKHLSPGELAAVEKTVREVADWCAENGIKFYMVMPPHKHYVYPEHYLDGWTWLKGAKTRYEEFRDRAADAGLPLVDTHAALLEAKKTSPGPLYYKNDTHWTGNGAYAAYKEIIKAIKKDFPDIFEYSDEDVEYRPEKPPYPGDLANMLPSGTSHRYEPILQSAPKKGREAAVTSVEPPDAGPYTRSYVKTTDNGSAPYLFIVRDSFYIALEPFMLKSFSKVDARWVWGISPMIFKEELLKKKPDILVWEVQSRYLTALGREDFNTVYK